MSPLGHHVGRNQQVLRSQVDCRAIIPDATRIVPFRQNRINPLDRTSFPDIRESLHNHDNPPEDKKVYPKALDNITKKKRGYLYKLDTNTTMIVTKKRGVD
jgi:hypothetical protein